MASNESIKPAELLKKSKPHLIPGKMNVVEWTFRVPLNYSELSGETVRLVAKSIERAEPGDIYETDSNSVKIPPQPSSGDGGSSSSWKPWIFWQEGGPGGPVPAPQDAYFAPYLLEKGYRVMMLDQRGAGLSSTLTARTLRERGSPAEQAAFLKLFRADNNARDIEAVRLAVTADEPDEAKRKISLMGDSYGGFIITAYIGMFQDSAREIFLAGGLPPLGVDVGEIYRKLVWRAAQRSRAYYEKYPKDENLAKKMVRFIHQNADNPEDTTLLGGKLSETRFRAIGINMGYYGGPDRMHNLMFRMEDDLETFGFWTRPTKWTLEDADTFDNHILYALFLDVAYLDGPGKAANWPAERALKESEDYGKASSEHPIFFYSELITHNTYTDSPELRQLLETAEILEADTNWSRLYNKEALANNKVPVYAAVYYDDLFVDFDFSMNAARKVKGTKLYITNRSYHDGIRTETKLIMDNLFALRDETLD